MLFHDFSWLDLVIGIVLGLVIYVVGWIRGFQNCLNRYFVKPIRKETP